MSVSTRPAQVDDAAAICDVLRRSIAETCVADHQRDPAILEAWLRNKTVDSVQRWIEAPDGYMIVAELDDRLAGVAQWVGGGTIVSCYVAPGAQHRGVGRELLGQLEREARQRGMPALQLASTRTAHGFYRRHGYVETGEVETMFGLAAVRMRKPLV